MLVFLDRTDFRLVDGTHIFQHFLAYLHVCKTCLQCLVRGFPFHLWTRMDSGCCTCQLVKIPTTEFLPSDEWLQKSNRAGSFSVAGQWAQGLRITIAEENPPFGPSGRRWPPGNQSHCSDCRGPIWFKTFYQFTESQLNFKTPFDITTENTILCLV